MQRLKFGFLGALFLAAVCAALWSLLSARFESGDIYPKYSSLRPDPLGTAALMEALEGLKGVKALRHYKDLDKVESPEDSTVFYLGHAPWYGQVMHKDEAARLEKLATKGARVILSFVPEHERPRWDRAEVLKAKKKGEEAKKKERKRAWQKDAGDEGPAVDELCGLRAFHHPMITDSYGFLKDNPAKPAPGADPTLPKQVLWHGSLAFSPVSAGWTKVLLRQGEAVMMEKAHGRGSLVVMSDSYFLSNEGLKKDRQAGLILWLLGGREKAVFDEAHLGVRDSSSLHRFVKELGLLPLFYGLIGLALLWLWRTLRPLLPPRPSAAYDATVRLSTQLSDGLAALFSRNVPQRELLQLLFESWRKAHRGGEAAREREERAHKILEAPVAPLDAYQQISVILNPKRKP